MPVSAHRAKSKMTLDDIKDLIETVIAKDITEFEFQSGEQKIRICREGAPSNSRTPPPYVIVTSPQPAQAVVTPQGNSSAPQPAPAAPPEPPDRRPPETAAADKESQGHMVTSPIVGTFYESSSPGAPAFVQVGDKVHAGQVLCIIEAMKLMNEIEAETSGVITKRFVSNGQPVEYGEALFAIDTRG
jgi:acetyl-CoA carboxylase biotin carboxyl carrier protein